jgi:hypothetical protein
MQQNSRPSTLDWLTIQLQLKEIGSHLIQGFCVHVEGEVALDFERQVYDEMQHVCVVCLGTKAETQ